MPQHGTCTVCQRQITLTSTGKVGHHLNGRTSLTDPRRGQRCAGAGQPPTWPPLGRCVRHGGPQPEGAPWLHCCPSAPTS